MHRFCLVCTAQLSLLVASVAAQQPVSPQTPAPLDSPASVSQAAPKVAYYDETGFRLPSEAGADYRTETTYRDSVTGVVREYFLPSNKLKRCEVYNPKDDFTSAGECFAENVQPVPFFKLR